jgi:hypothetical protein
MISCSLKVQCKQVKFNLSIGKQEQEVPDIINNLKRSFFGSSSDHTVQKLSCRFITNDGLIMEYIREF